MPTEAELPPRDFLLASRQDVAPAKQEVRSDLDLDMAGVEFTYMPPASWDRCAELEAAAAAHDRRGRGHGRRGRGRGRRGRAAVVPPGSPEAAVVPESSAAAVPPESCARSVAAVDVEETRRLRITSKQKPAVPPDCPVASSGSGASSGGSSSSSSSTSSSDSS